MKMLSIGQLHQLNFDQPLRANRLPPDSKRETNMQEDIQPHLKMKTSSRNCKRRLISRVSFGGYDEPFSG